MESDNDFISLSSDKVVALCEPTKSFRKEYAVAKSQLHSISKMRQSYYDALDNDYIQNIVDELGELYSTYEDEEELEPVKKSTNKEDESKGKVLQFPKKDDDTGFVIDVVQIAQEVLIMDCELCNGVGWIDTFNTQDQVQEIQKCDDCNIFKTDKKQERRNYDK